MTAGKTTIVTIYSSLFGKIAIPIPWRGNPGPLVPSTKLSVDGNWSMGEHPEGWYAVCVGSSPVIINGCSVSFQKVEDANCEMAEWGALTGTRIYEVRKCVNGVYEPISRQTAAETALSEYLDRRLAELAAGKSVEIVKVKELPCRLCSRPGRPTMNDAGVQVCWSCGQEP